MEQGNQLPQVVRPLNEYEYWRSSGPSHSRYSATHSGAEPEISCMNPEIYRAVTTGNVNDFQKSLEDPELSLLTQVSPRGNSVLHIASSFGHDDLVIQILFRCPDLFSTETLEGDAALHLAASAGHLSTVQLLIDHAITTQTGDGDFLKVLNKKKKTALHVALENNQEQVARILFLANFQLAFCLDMDDISPLYLAVKAGYKDLVEQMLLNHLPSTVLNESLNGKSIADPAVAGGNKDVLDIVLTKCPGLASSKGEKGMTPLCLASSLGNLDVVGYILSKFSGTMYLKSRRGDFPIHIASEQGHLEVIMELLKYGPDSWELLNKEGRNILHVAAMFDKSNVVSYVLREHSFQKLINERDEYGRTPLHLAVINQNPYIVSTLTWDKRVNMEIKDKNDYTARDYAEKNKTNFRERLTLIAMHSAGAPINQSRPILYAQNYQDRIGTLIVVSTLVATMSFAAGFTVPGGYNDSNPDLGMATLVTKLLFQSFLICNTVAMYSSIIVVATLIWAQLGDAYFIVSVLNVAVPLLGLSLAATSVAFMTGLHLVVSNLHWLANVVMIIGSISVFNLLIVFVPLFLPMSSSNRVARYIFYYPFLLIEFVTTTKTIFGPKKKNYWDFRGGIGTYTR